MHNIDNTLSNVILTTRIYHILLNMVCGIEVNNLHMALSLFHNFFVTLQFYVCCSPHAVKRIIVRIVFSKYCIHSTEILASIT